mgnify:CR=1 FL=1|tara:strand:+ start:4493 stop:6778 length:2286 start_codon:yes stop_codon:yes gene_type:complete
MSRNSFDININLKGFPKAHQELNKTKDGMDRLRGSTSGLRRQVGALRNNILLFSFAVGGAAVVVNKFVQASAGFQSVRARLVGLTGGVVEANKAFDRFNAVAGTTPFQLQDVVDAGAQLEAFGVNSKATLSAVTDLAAFMGTTATQAASAMGRAFAGGAGAADILRERGILQLIKDSEGIEDLTDLTLPEFRKALVSALTDPDGRISGSAKRLSNTYQGAVSNMQDAVVRFQATVGDILIPTLTESVKWAEKFIRGFNKKEILEAATAISIVATTFGIYKIAADLAAGATLKFQKSLKRIGLAGLAMILGVAIDKMLEATGAFESVSDEAKDFQKELEDQVKELDEYKKSLSDVTEATKDLEEETDGITETLQKKVMSLTLQAMALDGADTKTLALVESGGKLSAQDLDNIKTIDRLKKAIEDMNKAIKEREEREKMLSDRKALSLSLDADISRNVRLMSVLRQSENDKIEENIQKETLRLDTISQIQDALDLSATGIAPLVNGLDIMNTELDKNANNFKLANGDIITFGKENNELVEKIILSAQTMQIYNDTLNANAEAQRRAKEQAEARIPIEEVLLDRQIQLLEKNAMMAAGMVVTKDETDKASDSTRTFANGILAASRAMVSLRDSSEVTQGQILQTIGAMMMLFPGGQVPGAVLQSAGMFVGHTGGLIKNNGIQRFAHGGMVQGQDNVPILAQAGEFIMRREAVQNIGVQNLADMNQSGQSGGVTLNIQGNMIANDEFVRDTLIPQIAKASKQGLA